MSINANGRCVDCGKLLDCGGSGEANLSLFVLSYVSQAFIRSEKAIIVTILKHPQIRAKNKIKINRESLKKETNRQKNPIRRANV